MEHPEKLFFNLKLPVQARDFAIQAIESGYCGRIGEFVDKATSHIESIFNREVLLTANGTIALELALRTLNVGYGDIVLVQNVSFVATANAVNSVGAKIIFIENIKNSVNPSPDSIEFYLKNKEFSNNIKALIIAPLYGVCSPFIQVYKELCEKYKIPLIEDAAQSFGSKYKDEVIGTFGDISTFSFFSNKTLASGQGGAIVFKNKNLADTALSISKHGQSEHGYTSYGSNLGFNNLSASLLYANLLSFNSYVIRRKEIFSFYKEIIESENIPIDILIGDNGSISWVLPISRKDKSRPKKELIQFMQKKRIAIREGMSYLPNFPHIKQIKHKPLIEFKGERPDEILLPIHHGMDKKSVLRVTKALKKGLNI